MNKVEISDSQPLDVIAAIDAAWINERLDFFGLKARDLVAYLGLGKSAISLTLSGKRNLSQSGKAAFFYFFKYYEVISSNEKENLQV